MFFVDQLLLATGVLILLGIVSSKFSARLGLPVLVLFLAVGMLAGSEGLGGLEFTDIAIAHGIGTAALAVILFDGGLRTPLRSLQLVWKPSLVLATLGVLITSVITGLAASWILGIPLLEGILLGGIIGSTDAAAVFSLLRGAGVKLRERLAATLEIESGSNDPMAIFLTVGLIEVLLGRMELGVGVVGLFLTQMGFGAATGAFVGWLSIRLINKINLEAAGLYPVLTGACAMLAYGIAAIIGGSGFLSVYIAGIFLGNSKLVFKRGTFLFYDGIAWAGQITMFVVLGLLSFPSDLLDVAVPGLAVAAVLIFVARPLTIFPILLPFRYTLKEMTLISWVGLKGAVPIVLATFPLMLGVNGAEVIFNVVFFVVLISAVTQGWSLPLVARYLGLEEEAEATPDITLEITSLRDVDADIVEYTVGPETRAAGKRLNQLALPEGVVVAMIARQGNLIPPRGSTRIEGGDHVFVVLRPETRVLVDRVFSRNPRTNEALPALIEFPLMGSTTALELDEFYGIQLGVDGLKTLDEVIRDQLGSDAVPGSTLVVHGVTLHVREMEEGRITTVGLAIPTSIAG